MGSLQRITECVLAHVPDGRSEQAKSTLEAMTDLCRWVDGGPIPLNPRIDASLVQRCRTFLGTHPELYVSRRISAESNEVAAIVVDTRAATDRLRSAFPRRNVRNDVAEAIPWTIDAALWQPLKGRIDAAVPDALKEASAKDRAAALDMIKEITHSYVLAVLGGDDYAITNLKPLVRAMPQLVLIGIASAPDVKEPMAAFIYL